MRRPVRLAAAALALLALGTGGCSTLVSNATTRLGENLTAGIVNHDDPETVAAALPAYLLLLDGFLEADPANASLNYAAARLYAAYAGSFVADPQRRNRLANRALKDARRGVCSEDAALCGALDAAFETFDAELARADAGTVPRLAALGGAWAGVIEADTASFDRIAELPKVEAIFRRIVALDPAYDHGTAWMYLGVLACLRPASLGGAPDAGRAAFERSIALSGGRNQMARVLYAEHYARLVFDQPLHDRLLAEALAADPAAPGLTLANVLAQRRARELVASGKDYF